jgi:hypothetical protein
MSLVSMTIANLINGVSQQPYALRLASQCDLQENCNSSVVDGLCMRNGTRHSAKIGSTPVTNAFTHMINRDEINRFRVVLTGGDLKVYDLHGVQKTVNVEAGAAAYLASATPAEDFTALTVADYTFILNKTTTVAQGTHLVPSRPFEALYWVRSAVPDAAYSLTVDGFNGTYICGDADNIPGSVDTSSIAAFITSSNSNAPTTGSNGVGVAMGGAYANYTFNVMGSVVRISRVNGADFSISKKDPGGDEATDLIKGRTQRFTNLPAKAWPDFTVEVQGEGSSFNQSYWVTYVADANNQFGGVWKECPKPGEADQIDKTTMPHILVHEADDTFTFKAATWEDRKVGDITTGNPMPSFVGRKINDIFFHRNRLGFLSDESMILSCSGDYFNFFKGSAIQVLDTDPIDIAVSNTKVAILNHAVPFNESLLLFSDQTQFMLGRTNDALTAKTANIDPTTEFECSADVKPINVGNFVYFVQKRDSFSAVREFSVDAFTQTKDAQDVTSHVPKYVPDGVFKLTAANTENIMVALSHNAPSTLFVYQYYLANGSKLQSAWHKWTFDPTDTILNADFIGSDLHLIISRPDGLYLEVMTVNSGFIDPAGDQPFSFHLDRQLNETQVSALTYDAVSDTTSFTLPYTPQAGETFSLVAWSGNDPKFKTGRKLAFTRSGATITVTAKGNLQHFRFGRVFKARYVFSRFEIRESASGGGETVVSEGRVNVRRMSLAHGKSGYFRVEVTPRGRDTYRTIMSGRQVGNSQSLLGEVALIDGTIKVPVMAATSTLRLN